MSFFALIKSFIYLVSSCLLFPTLFLLAILTLVIILYAGSFLAELLERLKLPRLSVNEFKKAIADDNFKSVFPHRVIVYIGELKEILKSGDGQLEADVEYLLQKSCNALIKPLDKFKILIRLGPALGLIGTLIPMGTGLAGLSQGDMTKLTSDLVIAFTTTVVGLALGMVAYCLFIIKKRWYDEDIRNMEYITEILDR